MAGPAAAPARVSVVLAVRNEAPYIEATVRSLLAQRGEGLEFEVIAVDGGSDDGTRRLLTAMAAADPRLQMLDNPRRTAPAAFNIGLAAARHEYVGIFGAHARYAPHYVATCVAEMRARGAVGCSGALTTTAAGAALQARLVAWAMSSAFGSSSRSVRTQPEGWSDSAPFGVYEKRALLEAGGWDERLVRNQDNDMWEKLRARGGKLWLTHATRAEYFPKGDLAGFARYAFNGGFWNAVSLRRTPRSMRLRHFVPLVFVLALVAAAVCAALPWRPAGLPAFTPLAALLALHLGAGLLAAAQVARRERSAAALLLPGVFLLFHGGYGAGTLAGLLARPGGDAPRGGAPARG